MIRWTAAVLVFAVAGCAATYAVTRPERTKIPGLRTPDDGRWTYPPIALPKLPAGEPHPLAAANPAGVHYVDERALLLPVPEGAAVDHSFPGTGGWLPSGTYENVYDFAVPDARTIERVEMTGDGLRHIAARAWTMPDGTRTEVYLLQFITAGYRTAYETEAQSDAIKGAPDTDTDSSVQSSAIPKTIQVTASAQKQTHGVTHTRYAFISAGDTLGLVLQTGKGPVARVPFEQTVRLQAQLLG